MSFLSIQRRRQVAPLHLCRRLLPISYNDILDSVTGVNMLRYCNKFPIISSAMSTVLQYCRYSMLDQNNAAKYDHVHGAI